MSDIVSFQKNTRIRKVEQSIVKGYRWHHYMPKPLRYEESMRKWHCVVCGFIFDEALGMPEDGIPPGTRWEDLPDDWQCPDCGVGKEDFELIHE